jgi:hypothetical protein
LFKLISFCDDAGRNNKEKGGFNFLAGRIYFKLSDLKLEA